MTEEKKLHLGDPVILTQHVDNLDAGMVGMVNSLIEVEGIEYAMFMPTTEQKSYVLRSAKLEYLDEDAIKNYPELEAFLTKLNTETPNED